MAPVLHSFRQEVQPQQSFGYLINAFPSLSVLIRLPGQTSMHFTDHDAHRTDPPLQVPGK